MATLFNQGYNRPAAQKKHVLPTLELNKQKRGHLETGAAGRR
jgi:hypothetical protein